MDHKCIFAFAWRDPNVSLFKATKVQPTRLKTSKKLTFVFLLYLQQNQLSVHTC